MHFPKLLNLSHTHRGYILLQGNYTTIFFAVSEFELRSLLTGQMLYHLSQPYSLFCFSYFLGGYFLFSLFFRLFCRYFHIFAWDQSQIAILLPSLLCSWDGRHILPHTAC
jgi:ABC-type thiamin/hydroxymethylpyrimidine transport system permease subunit